MFAGAQRSVATLRSNWSGSGRGRHCSWPRIGRRASAGAGSCNGISLREPPHWLHLSSSTDGSTIALSSKSGFWLVDGDGSDPRALGHAGARPLSALMRARSCGGVAAVSMSAALMGRRAFRLQGATLLSLPRTRCLSRRVSASWRLPGVKRRSSTGVDGSVDRRSLPRERRLGAGGRRKLDRLSS